MIKLLPLVLLFLLNFEQAFAVFPAGRTLSHCTYLNDKIYCYGGSNEDTYYSDVLSLQVRNESITHLETLKNSWQIINPVPDYGSEGRIRAHVIASPDRTKMYIQGGNAGDAVFQNPFIVFDANTETWSTLPDFEQLGLGQSPIYDGTVVYSRYIDRFAFYGGHMRAPNNATVTVDGTVFNENNGRFDFGFYNLTTFNIATQRWTMTNTARNNNTVPFIYQSGSVSWLESVVYIGGFGGKRSNMTDTSIIPFNYIRIYTLSSHFWQEVNCIGEIPPNREYFTTTLLPDGETVLLFGGRNIDNTTLDNPCYLLNLNTKVWSLCRSNDPSHRYENRAYHSAVLVGDHLFILFGMDDEKNYRDDMIILDVFNRNNISLVTNYAYKESVPVVIEVPSLEFSPGGLSTGAIVGIVLGCVILIAVILGILFFNRKKNKATNKFPEGWDDDLPENSYVYRENIHVPKGVKENSTNAVSKDLPPKYTKSGHISTSHSDHTSVVRSKQPIRTKPEQLNTVKPEHTSALECERPIQIKPEEINRIKPEQSEVIKPEQCEVIKPEQSKVIKPEQCEVIESEPIK